MSGWTRADERNEQREERVPAGSERQDVRKQDDSEFRYQPPSNLPDPEPREGFVHTWIRVEVMGRPDPQNVFKATRVGWEPCKAVDYPELAHSSVVSGSGTIEVGGLMLCRIPEVKYKARSEYYAKMAQAQMEGVDQTLMKQSDERTPLFVQRKSKVVFGTGR